MIRSALERSFGWCLLLVILTAVLLAGPSIGRAEVCDGLVARWSFDEGHGNSVQEVAGAVDDDGTLVNGPSWLLAGFSGSALDFDGVDDRVQVPLSTDLTMTAGLTLSAWVRVGGQASGNSRIVGAFTNSTGYMLRLDLDVDEITLAAAGTHTASHAVPRRTWFHVAGTYDAATGMSRIYVNGLQISSGQCSTAPCSPNPPSGPLAIGSSSTGSGALTGQIDEVRIYNRALSAGEVAELAMPASISIGLVADWHLDAGGGVSAKDDAGAVEDAGTLVGSPIWTSGYRGMGLSFDGVNDRVEVPLSADLATTAGLTLSAWIFVDPSAAGTKGVVSTFSGSGYDLRLDLAADRVDFTANGTVSKLWRVPRGVWVHLAGTCDAATAISTIYVNGSPFPSEQTCTPAPCNPSPPAVPLTIGSLAGGTGAFRGLIDEVRLYNRALSASEVAEVAVPTTLNISMVGQWCLDEGGGTAALDVAGAVSDDGILLNGPIWTTGHHGTALSFDGVNDAVQAPVSVELAPSTGLTLCAWLNVDPTAAGTVAVVGAFAGSGYFLRLNLTGSTIDFYGGAGTVFAPFPIPRAVWFHVGATFDVASGWSTIYVNGTPVGSGQVCGPCSTDLPNGPLLIGSSSVGGILPFRGMIDEVTIHARPLTPSEIARLADTVPQVVGVGESSPTIANLGLELSQFPNPFQTSTTLAFQLSRPERVRSSLRDLAGRHVRVLQPWSIRETGRHVLAWDGLDDHGRPVTTGVYYWDLQVGERRFSRTLIRIR